MIPRPLTYDQARRFYDRLGSAQDTQAVYEAPALENLVHHADLENATAVLEFGAGTGQLAARLLARHLPSSARYTALDVSSTMVALTHQRLTAFGPRVQVQQTDGTVRLPLPDQAVDRVLTTYVLDLLSEADIRLFVAEARRVLLPGGLLAIASLTTAFTPGARILQRFWMVAYRWSPRLVGGCRPVELAPYLVTPNWELCHSQRLVRFGMPSQVLVARSLAADTAAATG
jgi:ubiquinone/menaquinone biosynthesis C-methylase UbiE